MLALSVGPNRVGVSLRSAEDWNSVEWMGPEDVERILWLWTAYSTVQANELSGIIKWGEFIVKPSKY
jgi:hypothetical protein